MAAAYVMPSYVPTETLLTEFRQITSVLNQSGTFPETQNNHNKFNSSCGKAKSKCKREGRVVEDVKEEPASKKQHSEKSEQGRSSRMRYPNVKPLLPAQRSKAISASSKLDARCVVGDIFDNISDDGVDLDDGMLFSPEDQIHETENSGIKFDDCSRASEEYAESENDFRTKIRTPLSSGHSPVSLFSNCKSTSRKRLNQIVPYPRKPRQADYSCSICSEDYQCTVNENPWWAVYKHECPHCKQFQIPRIDISTASNAIELDPNVIALYGEGIEDGGDDEDSDNIDECNGMDEDDIEDLDFESEDDSFEFREPANPASTDDEIDSMKKDEASKLLILMCHARTCSGRHSSPKHEEICRSTKFLMLHIRDCKGMDGQGRECQFPWCKPCKKMLKHLSSCSNPEACDICCPL
eukprot:gene6478-6978_t